MTGSDAWRRGRRCTRSLEDDAGPCHRARESRMLANACEPLRRAASERHARSAASSGRETSASAAEIAIRSPAARPMSSTSTPRFCPAAASASELVRSARRRRPRRCPRRTGRPRPTRREARPARRGRHSRPPRRAIAHSASAQASPPSLTSWAATTTPARTESRTSSIASRTAPIDAPGSPRSRSPRSLASSEPAIDGAKGPTRAIASPSVSAIPGARAGSGSSPTMPTTGVG